VLGGVPDALDGDRVLDPWARRRSVASERTWPTTWLTERVGRSSSARVASTAASIAAWTEALPSARPESAASSSRVAVASERTPSGSSGGRSGSSSVARIAERARTRALRIASSSWLAAAA
jgi:hypothetical protein